MSTQTATLTLRELALDIKSTLVNGENVDVESYVEKLSEQSGINLYDIKDIYNCMFQVNEAEIDTVGKRRWVDYEDNLINRYTDLSLKYGASVSESLKDLEELLKSRTYASLVFRYYKVLHVNPKTKAKTKQGKTKKIQTKKVSKPIVPKVEKEEVKEESEMKQEEVISEHVTFDEPAVIEQTVSNEPVSVETTQPIKKPKEEFDLIDAVAEIVENVETANVDVTSFFKGILELSRKAVENNKDEAKVKSLENDLKTEKEYNKMLEDEYTLLLKDLEVLKQEVVKYDGMTSKDKLRNFREYNETVKYMVDKFGEVSRVHEEKQSV